MKLVLYLPEILLGFVVHSTALTQLNNIPELNTYFCDGNIEFSEDKTVERKFNGSTDFGYSVVLHTGRTGLVELCLRPAEFFFPVMSVFE